jgi:hypothetical protein
VDGDAGQTLAGDVAVLEIQATSSDIDGKGLATELAQRHIGHAAHGSLEQNNVCVCDFDHHVINGALADDLQGFIDDEAFLVESRLDHDDGARLGGLDGGGDGSMVTAVQRVDGQGWWFGLCRRGRCRSGASLLLRLHFDVLDRFRPIRPWRMLLHGSGWGCSALGRRR